MWLTDVFPIKYSIPLMYDYDVVRRGLHGMGSGSGGTNFDETLVHRALQYECAQLNGESLNPYSQCLGDDGILTFPGITTDKVVDTYTRHGQVMQLGKQGFSTEECVYLRRYHHVDYRVHGTMVGIYSTYRALNRLKMMERSLAPDMRTDKMMALRELSIVENVKWHPTREKFAMFCLKGSKYKLGLAIPGFLDNISSIAREAIEQRPDLLGYTKSNQLGLDTPAKVATSIKDWWIYKFLKHI